jgi:hypothetical protein
MFHEDRIIQGGWKRKGDHHSLELLEEEISYIGRERCNKTH